MTLKQQQQINQARTEIAHEANELNTSLIADLKAGKPIDDGRLVRREFCRGYLTALAFAENVFRCQAE